MRQNSIDTTILEIDYLVGDRNLLSNMASVHSMQPFDDRIIGFLNLLSKKLLTDKEARGYPDVITFAFWIRKASVEKLKSSFKDENDSILRIGRGLAFHIAPSNVPVNYAYSLVTGLLAGNANVVRLPSKEFVQVTIINRCIIEALDEWTMIKPYILLVRYGHDKLTNDVLSANADIRVIWGGDGTIKTLRESPIKPRSTEITFSDRFSLAVIDSEEYMSREDKKKIASDFYNDTYLTDQNACTSPKVVVWMGSKIKKAKKLFWSELHDLVVNKYTFQPIQAVNKLTSSYLLAANNDGIKKETSVDNFITRMNVKNLNNDLLDYEDNSGYFFEYDCENILDLKSLCDDTRCQTLSYIGNKELFIPLIKSGIKGIDRIVPVGKTMDFDFNWDGYNLYERMTRNVKII